MAMSSFPLWFNRDIQSPVVPEALRPYLTGKHYLSTKQVPSATILSRAGSMSVTANRDILFRSGFILTEQDREGREATRDLTVRRTRGSLSAPSGSLASLLEEVSSSMDLLNQDSIEPDEVYEHSGSENSDPEDVLEEQPKGLIRFRDKAQYRIKYEDPWKIHAARVLADLRNESPEIVLWGGDGYRLQDPLPTGILGATWGSSKNRIRFHLIVDDDVKHNVIYRHTHWGRKLHELCNAKDDMKQSWARTLRTRINRFLKGRSDPSWSKAQRETYLVDPEKTRDRKSRALRFIELLKTVDGIFVQRYLCFPEEVWTWDRFDLFTLGNISYLLGDEFLDGEVTQTALELQTAYSQLKGSRKWFKMHSHRGTLESALAENLEEVPRWCRQFANVWKRAASAQGYRRNYLFGVLSQTRGSGTPPALVVLQSKMKFLRTISKEPIPPQYKRKVWKAAAEEVISTIPDSAFTGFGTKSRVTVSTSSCWESTRREGGTTEEIRNLITSLEPGSQVPKYDLMTGKVSTYLSREDCETTGEFIFWVCLDRVLRTPPEELNVAFLTVVKEPGKARSVTKARACLKVVLDLVSKICAEPLKKGIRSSTSGMAASNHGWNFFNRLTSEELEDLVFSLENRDETAYEGYVERTDTFRDVFVSSTDFEEATDQMQHTVARDLGDMWMRKCGIPDVLRGIVVQTCFYPREVYFYATGVLETIGTPAPLMGEGVRSVTLRTGVLMGDPLTKIVLHLVNAVTRHIGIRLFEPDFYERFRDSRRLHEAFLLGLHNKSLEQ